MKAHLFTILSFTVFTFLLSLSAFGQIPDKFENLQVLPKEISKKELVELMKSFTSGLGQSCEYCHVGEGRDLATFDFASDEKVHKKTARAMIQMVRAINDQYLKEIPSDSKMRVSVTCATCHHGQSKPVSIEDVLRAKIQDEGIEPAKQKYKELRKQYYGDYVYDFTEGPLIRLATDLAQQDKLQESLNILELNAEFNPPSAWNELLMADVLLKSGKKTEALQHYRNVLKFEPENEWIKKKIAELEATPK